MGKRKTRKMSDLNKTRSTKQFYNKFLDINESLRSEKRAYGDQVIHFMKLVAKEGKKPSRSVMNPTSGRERDNIRETGEGLKVAFKGSQYFYKF